MCSDSKPQPTVGIVLPWVNMTFDQTEQVSALIPEQLMEWRLPDPSGRWHFSLAEIVMHCADARRMFARQLSGSESTEGYWSTGPAGDDGVWGFGPYPSREAVLESLKDARAEFQTFLDKPASCITEVTDGTQQIFQTAMAKLRERGESTGQAELRGPANIVRVLMAGIAHESGHRSSLQTLLRLHGINLPQE
jgi:hypothetical protein